ncbi:MAG TPA: SUMF1/EgtB/PvdO family nonheme iron enzyme [Blastocatellia bacterium]|nr:SUMF1/EgtB/PvdO family nonheme iron enzyme [Blastocatellia bacterium]
MMYCDRCNIDFSEGLRYCKWCGQTLVERQRSTSELSACSNCGVALQPSWVFCKSCGVRVTPAAREPAAESDWQNEPTQTVAGEMSSTSVIQSCSSCGERVEQGSVYCKACGAALYEPQTPFGASAMLCSVCHSYSPVGSTACRVCGALLIETASSVAEEPAETVTISKKESSTLPDLAEHLPADLPGNTAERASHFGDDEIESGAHTLALTEDEAKRVADQSLTPAAPRPKGGDTSMLPGVAGSKFEQPLPTSSLHKERTTGPVEGEESENAQPPAAVVEPERPRASPVTRVDTAGMGSPKENTAGESTVQFISAADLNLPQNDQGTVAFGSGATPPAAFRNEDQTSGVNLSQEAAPREQMRTDQFAATPPTVEIRHTGSNDSRAFEGVTNQVEPFSKTVAEPVRLTERNIAARQNESQTAIAEPPPAQKKSNATIIAAIASLIVLAVTALALWWFVFGGKPARQTAPPVAETPPTSQPTPPAPPPTEKPPAPIVPEGMVMVPAGVYTIGRNDESDLEKPEHTVNLPAFFIDRTEVTNADYKKFVDATSRKPPANWNGGTYPPDRADYPVTSITWQDAADYAQWAGKRLPTEAEWEAAARGSDGRRYPWGNDWRTSFANIDVKAGKKNYEPREYPKEIKPVGQYAEGASTSGALDLVGNVWEFTADEFRLYPGNPINIEEIRLGPNLKLKLEPGKTYRIIRGGAFDGDKTHDASYRGLIDASQPYAKTGFRCVKDAK